LGISPRQPPVNQKTLRIQESSWLLIVKEEPGKIRGSGAPGFRIKVTKMLEGTGDYCLLIQIPPQILNELQSSRLLQEALLTLISIGQSSITPRPGQAKPCFTTVGDDAEQRLTADMQPPNCRGMGREGRSCQRRPMRQNNIPRYLLQELSRSSQGITGVLRLPSSSSSRLIKVFSP